MQDLCPGLYKGSQTCRTSSAEQRKYVRVRGLPRAAAKGGSWRAARHNSFAFLSPSVSGTLRNNGVCSSTYSRTHTFLSYLPISDRQGSASQQTNKYKTCNAKFHAGRPHPHRHALRRHPIRLRHSTVQILVVL